MAFASRDPKALSEIGILDQKIIDQIAAALPPPVVKITVSPTEPTNPNPNDLWIDTSE
jgi:hypothetical protein